MQTQSEPFTCFITKALPTPTPQKIWPTQQAMYLLFEAGHFPTQVFNILMWKVKQTKHIQFQKKI